MPGHKAVIRTHRGRIRVSCECTSTYASGYGGSQVTLGDGSRPKHVWYGFAKDWPETVKLFNEGEHNGEFRQEDHLGSSRGFRYGSWSPAV